MKYKVLLIEDNAITRKFVRVTLEREGYEIIESYSGAQALEAINQVTPHIVLMDMRLPDGSGEEFAKALRAVPKMTYIPIVAFTGFVPDEMKMRFPEAPFNGYILKPIEASQLTYLVKEHLTPLVIPESLSKKKILVVDDNAAQLRLTKAILTQHGFDVILAMNGAEALERVKTIHADLVLSDILMPLMDGFKLCLAIKKDPELRKIPVILASSHFLEIQDRELAREMGAYNLVERTPHLKEIVENIVLAVQSEKQEQLISGRDTTEAYESRLVRQLERQTALNQVLSKKNSFQNRLVEISKNLSRHKKIETTLPSAFAQCLDLSGLSFGAIFLKNSRGGLGLRTQVGFSEKARDFFKLILPQFLSWSEGQQIVIVPSSKVTDKITADFSDQAGLRVAAIAPITSGQDSLGILLIGADSQDLDKEDWVALAQGMANQFGQALTLSQAVSKLNLYEDRSRIFMENANDGILVLDLNGRILEANKKAYQLFARPENELLGKKFRDFLAEHQKNIQEELISAKNLAIMRPDDSFVEIDFSASSVQLASERFIFALLHDVTERNHLQQMSVQSEKLASMGAMTASVAHEINNPLSYVLTNVELLSDCLSGLTPSLFEGKREWIEKSIRQIRDGVSRVKNIASDLKVFSRSRETEKSTVINLVAILESSLSMAAHETRFKARVIKNLQPISHVYAHEGRLGQVFLNLFINAAQAIPEGNVSSNEISVLTENEGSFVKVRISDTGPGIAPDVLNRLFTPFFTTKPQGVGTGLGLSICKNIIEDFGGKISVQSELGRGTTFTILLPAASQKASPKVSSAAIKTQSPVPRGRVLIVDDEPELAEVYGQVLGLEHEVVIMTNGLKAFQLLMTDNSYDVILSDLTMPDMSGMDVFLELLKLNRGLEDRFLFMTGGVFTAKAQEFIKNIPNLCVEKPVETKVLRQVVGDVIRRHKESLKKLNAS